MELLIIGLLILVIYLLVTNRRELNERTEHLEVRLLELQRMFKEQPATRQPVPETIKPEPAPASQPNEYVQKPLPPPPLQPAKPQPPVIAPENIERHQEVISDTTPALNKPAAVPVPPSRPYRKPEPQLSFFERHPDLEKFIGENLVNKIGIAILVLAIGFFVKYAIDNNWIGPVGRVGVGVLCGAVLIGIAHRLRTTYRSFSSVLVGGGLAVLYFTITLAYHEFHLFSQTVSFIILIVITCFAVALSLLYDKQELAVIALVGGLASPFMVSSGQANYHALFIYLIILNTGLLAIAYNKLWRVLNISAFGLTVVVTGAIIFSLSKGTYGIGLLYVSILYLLFLAINMANNVREHKKFIGADFTILLINTAMYFAAGLYLLSAMQQYHLRGLFTAGLGALNLLLSFILFRNRKVDTNVLYLLIGITLTFVSLTAPIQLNGHYITLFWAAETVVLFWLYQKSGIGLKKLTSMIIWVLMLISLFMDWADLYGSSFVTYPVMANKGFITTVIAAISSFLLSRLIAGKDDKLCRFKLNADIFRYTALVLLFMSGLFEINHQFENRYPEIDLNILYIMLYVPAFVYVLYILGKRLTAVRMNFVTSAVILAIFIVLYLTELPRLFDVQYAMLEQHKAATLHFIAHWVGAVITGLLCYELIMLLKQHLAAEALKIGAWLMAAVIVTFLSLEVSLASNLLFYKSAGSLDHITTVYIKTGLPVLWGLASFFMMWLGMRYKVQTLRVISLTLFSITLLKLFLFDIRNIPAAGKIAAFFCLGVLLLIVSFMYQKVKQIIVDDKPEEHV